MIGLAAIGAGVVLLFLVVGVVRVSKTISFKSDNKDKSEK